MFEVRTSYQLQGGCNCITNKSVAVVYSCVGQAVIVIIIVVSVELYISSVNSKENLIKTKTQIWFLLWFAIKELI